MTNRASPPAEQSVPTPLPLARAGTLPEDADYRDTGCDLSPSCLQCPLPQCRYDEPGGLRAPLNRTRDHEIHRLRFDHGVSPPDLARRFGISLRTICRVLAHWSA